MVRLLVDHRSVGDNAGYRLQSLSRRGFDHVMTELLLEENAEILLDILVWEVLLGFLDALDVAQLDDVLQLFY